MVGLTRFEDRRRYPHGISVNFTSFAAKLLAQVGTNTCTGASGMSCSPQGAPTARRLRAHHLHR